MRRARNGDVTEGKTEFGKVTFRGYHFGLANCSNGREKAGGGVLWSNCWNSPNGKYKPGLEDEATQQLPTEESFNLMNSSAISFRKVLE